LVKPSTTRKNTANHIAEAGGLIAHAAITAVVPIAKKVAPTLIRRLGYVLKGKKTNGLVTGTFQILMMQAAMHMILV
jgi:hypothetical protein